MRLAYVIGTRPEAIRSARLLHLVEAESSIELALITTGQHYDWNMMQGFLEELDVPQATHHLEVGHGKPGEQMGDITTAMSRVLEQDRPDAVCVFGDTNSSLATAIAAARAEVPVVHIEAGCRSFDMRMPEEINRRLIDHMSALLLAVSDVSKQNLERENVLGRTVVVGDPQFDVFSREAPQRMEVSGDPVGLLTLHRPQNVDDAATLDLILQKLSNAAEKTGVRWIFPVHPRTRKSLSGKKLRGVDLADPLLYRDLLALLSRSSVCVTDSGGLQKEALWMQVPCVTIRDSTEWLETLWQGVNVLAPPWTNIEAEVQSALDSRERDFSNPYGDGTSCERILEALLTSAADGMSFPLPPLHAPDVAGV